MALKLICYLWYKAQRRYFFETARLVNYSGSGVEMILDEVVNQVEEVIEHVSNNIPAKFPKVISQSIFDGMLLMREKLVRFT